MRQRRSRRNTLDEAVNILPLIDVLFLLLAFFIVLTTSMVLRRGIHVDLAKAQSGGKVSHEAEALEVGVDAAGALFLGDVPQTKESLLSTLREKFQAQADRRVLISADKNARHENVTAALDAVRVSGFRKITLNVSPETGR